MAQKDYSFTENSTSGNGRSVQDQSAPQFFKGKDDRFSHMAERDANNEPDFKEEALEGNGFAEQDPRHPDHQEHMTERGKEMFGDGKGDFNDPLVEEESSDKENPYREQDKDAN